MKNIYCLPFYCLFLCLSGCGSESENQSPLQVKVTVVQTPVEVFNFEPKILNKGDSLSIDIMTNDNFVLTSVIGCNGTLTETEYVISNIESNCEVNVIYDEDSDSDNIGNIVDEDDDNDGIPDTNDAFPLEPSEDKDFDLDGIGNNADEDDDNDGIKDIIDQFPFNPLEYIDSDGDNIGNNADDDDDNDNVLDIDDEFPLDPTETVDSDLDGIGNNADEDDDNDGLLDGRIVFEFEEQNLPTNWQVSGDISQAWQLSSLNAFQGLQSLASSNISDGQSAVLSFTLEVVNDGTLFGFNYLVSTEEDSDYLTFSIDNNILLQASGESDWQQFNTTLDKGTYHFSFTYEKDSYDDDGEDTVWIDNVYLITDNCATVANAEQVDTDGDLQGDLCDSDSDNDNVDNVNDAFPLDNTEWLDTDLDGFGNNTDNDDDGDTIPDNIENAHITLNPLNPDDGIEDFDGDTAINADEYFSLSGIDDVDSYPSNSPVRKIISPNNTNIAARFGSSIAVNGTSFITTGFNDEGIVTAYLYESVQKYDDPENNVNTENAWLLKSTINNVAIMPTNTILDENKLLLGNPRDSRITPDGGSVSVYSKNIEDQWQLEIDLTPLDNQQEDFFFGTSMATNNEYIIVGAIGDNLGLENHRNTGSAYVFQKEEGVWKQQQKLIASDFDPVARFGHSMDIYNDTLAIGSPDVARGGVYIFEKDDSGSWQETDILRAPLGMDNESLGGTVKFLNGKLYVNFPKGNEGKGAILEFRQNNSNEWVLEQTISLASELLINEDYRNFGSSSIIAGNDDSLIITAKNEENISHIHQFKMDDSSIWQLNKTIIIDSVEYGDIFASQINATQQFLFASSIFDDDQAENAGAVYVYDLLQITNQ